MRLRFVIGLFFVMVACDLSAQEKIGTLCDDGAWCWFSDPRAILLEEDKLVTGWVKKDGSVEVSSFDLQSKDINTSVIFERMEVDDHNNPAFCRLPDGNILTMYTWHSSKKGIVFHRSSTPADISSFSEPSVIRPGIEELLNEFPRETFTYANPFLLSGENNTIYSFGRWIGYKPNMIKSTDSGRTWTNPKVVISEKPFDPNNRPYVKYASDGKSRIDLIFTDGHPRVEPANGVYHCYYQDGAFWRSSGEKICSINDLPFEPQQATKVYTPDARSGRAWIADVALDKRGNPVILYTRHPEETDHRYHYATYNKKKNKWSDYEICRAGKWFPQTQVGVTEREPHYMGNLTLHPGNTKMVFLSRQVNGRFEIEQWNAKAKGKRWATRQITVNSEYDQVRPFVPRGSMKNKKTAVLWMENKKYIHYTDYDTRIKYFILE